MNPKIESIQTILKKLCGAVIIGLLSGSIAALFGRVLIYITEFRDHNAIYLLPFLGVIGFVIVSAYMRWGGKSVQGMNLVFNAGHGAERDVPIIMIPLVIVGTWLTHLFGGSAGREGVAVQIGGTIGYRLGQLLKDEAIARDFLIIGMAAGFAGLYRTPLAATFFALEVLVVGRLMYHTIGYTMLAAFVSSQTSAFWGLEKFAVAVETSFELNVENGFKLALIAAAFGLSGRLFSVLIAYLKKRFKAWLPTAGKRALFIGSALAAVLLVLHFGRYAGLGTNLINQSFSGGEIYVYDWLFKIILTAATLAAGFQGGEVTPLFAIGATLGVVLAQLFGLPILLIAAIGYAAVFASASNTLIAPIFIGAEVFGFAHMPYFFIGCVIAYSINGNRTIYHNQRRIDDVNAQTFH